MRSSILYKGILLCIFSFNIPLSYSQSAAPSDAPIPAAPRNAVISTRPMTPTLSSAKKIPTAQSAPTSNLKPYSPADTSWAAPAPVGINQPENNANTYAKVLPISN